MERIRNFVIVSHVDHGKSTLADRFLELTGTVDVRKMRPQYLDRMDLERERGITIKMQPVRMVYRPSALINRSQGDLGQNDQIEAAVSPTSPSEAIDQAKRFYVLNLIDTPGHADFSYEVSRALAAVEGAILLVDAAQGVQAQTVANFHLARAAGLAILPVINKIDLPSARIGETEMELRDLTGCGPEDVLKVSAKTGEGVADLLQAVVERIPPPHADRSKFRTIEMSHAARALIFDSHFDDYRGVIAHVRVVDGAFRPDERVAMLGAREQAEIVEVGYFSPELAPADVLEAGEIGYLATGLKRPGAVRVGDTITVAKSEIRDQKSEIWAVEALPGYREPSPVVFAGVYPEDAGSYAKLADALEKIQLTDAAIRFAPDTSSAFGRGWRVGFLGFLHMEIVAERIAREYGQRVLLTSPSVAYRITRTDGREALISAISQLPEPPQAMGEIAEPWVRLAVITRERDLGAVLALLKNTRGTYASQRSLGADRRMISYEAPLAEILVGFADALKSVTAGFGSFSYEQLGYRRGDLVRLDVLVAGRREPTLARVVARPAAASAGRALVAKLKALLPRALFPVSLQAAIGGRVIARETLPALKKDVTGYLYGGDRTRKMKLWAKQKRGKARLSRTGRVEIPPEVLRQLLKSDR